METAMFSRSLRFQLVVEVKLTRVEGKQTHFHTFFIIPWLASGAEPNQEDRARQAHLSPWSSGPLWRLTWQQSHKQEGKEGLPPSRGSGRSS